MDGRSLEKGRIAINDAKRQLLDAENARSKKRSSRLVESAQKDPINHEAISQATAEAARRAAVVGGEAHTAAYLSRKAIEDQIRATRLNNFRRAQDGVAKGVGQFSSRENESMIPMTDESDSVQISHTTEGINGTLLASVDMKPSVSEIQGGRASVLAPVEETREEKNLADAEKLITQHAQGWFGRIFFGAHENRVYTKITRMLYPLEDFRSKIENKISNTIGAIRQRFQRQNPPKTA